MLVDGNRQGQHHIALVLEEVFIKPLNHQDKGYDEHAADGEAEGGQEQDAQHTEKPGVVIQQIPHREVGGHGCGQQDADHRQHDPPGGPELVLQ